MPVRADNVVMSSTRSSTALTDEVVIRRAFPEDASTLARLALLDSQRPIAGPALLAERGGVAVAAVALDGSRTVADPFSPTADLVALLHLRADALSAPARSRRGRGPILRRRPAVVRG
jgi:hypothetical protein